MEKRTKLIPYSVYLKPEYYDKIRELAKKRQASGLIRDAIVMILDGNDTFKAGYNKGLRDSVKVVDNIQEIKVIAVKKKYLNDLIAGYIEQLIKP